MGGDAATAARTAGPQGTRVGRDRERDCGHESAVLAMNASSPILTTFVQRFMTFDDTLFMNILMTAHFHGYGNGFGSIRGSISVGSSDRLSSGSCLSDSNKFLNTKWELNLGIWKWMKKLQPG
jgi:hypothetical protein